MDHVAQLGFAHVVFSVLAYWLVTAAITRAILRRRGRSTEPSHYEHISDTEFNVTFTDTIHVGRFALVGFGPPLVFIILWLSL